MTPPEAPVAGINADAPGQRPAVRVPAVADPAVRVPGPVCMISTLNKRADFLRAASARRQSTPGFLLQARHRPAANTDSDVAQGIRVGFTCSKKLGNAVARNRAKRRLREAARATLPQHGRPGWDYVLVGRPEATASRSFALLLTDLARALTQIHGKP